MSPPYQTPVSDAPPVPDANGRKLRFWGHAIWASAAVLILLPAISVAGTFVGMTSAYATLRKTGATDSSELAENISIAILTTMWSVIAGVPVLIVFIISIIRYRRLGRSAMTPAPASRAF